jgi:hypothetical protein
MQHSGKHASTIDLLFEKVFSTQSVQRGCEENNWGNPLFWELSSAKETEKRWLYNWVEFAFQLTRSSAREVVKIGPQCVKPKNLHC